MRLIDADALKCELFKLMDRTLEYEDNLDEVVPLIDNAPTVEMFKALGTVDENGNIKIELLRPQGEWKEKVETKQLGYGWLTAHEIVCSVCGKEAEWLDGGSQFLSNFCPNCGAKMKEVKNDK